MPYKNKEDRSRRDKEYYLENKEHINKRNKEYWKRTREERNVVKRNHVRPYRRIHTNEGGKWECYYCKVTEADGATLQIHHKDQDHFNNKFDNLICLYKECHDKLHSKWQSTTITQLINKGFVSWEGELKDGI